MKIVDVKKLIRSIIILLLILLGLSFFTVKSCLSFEKPEYRTIYVKSGDTLWSIALNLQHLSYYNNKDVRYIIDDLKEINSLNNSSLYINQQIRVPCI